MRIFVVIGILLLCGGIAFAENLNAIRRPLLLNYGASPLLSVVFNHNTHKEVKCRTCHHIVDTERKRYVKCTIEGCHALKGSYESNPMSAFMAYHAKGTDRSCYGCHLEERNKYTSFKGCEPCHIGAVTKAPIKKAEK